MSVVKQNILKRVLRRALIPIYPELKQKKKRTLSEKFGCLRDFQINATPHEWKHLQYHYEICNLVDNVPGDFAEFGVAGGTTLLSLARILETKDAGLSGAEIRHIFGFDSFEGLPELEQSDIGIKRNDEMVKGGFYDPSGYNELFEFAEGKANIHLVKGWFEKSLPVFLGERPHISFSLIHMDADLYSSTLKVLELVWPHLSPSGILVFDELYNSAFPGETKAFREFFGNKTGKFQLIKSQVRKDKLIVKKLSA